MERARDFLIQNPVSKTHYPYEMNIFPQTAVAVIGVLAALVTCASAQTVVAPGAKLEKLSSEFSFTEGPTCDSKGNVFFTDQNNNRIMEWSVEGVLSTFMQPSGRANGMYMDAKGNLIACADEKNELWSIAPDKKVTVLIKDYQGKYLNGPNDVWVSAQRRHVHHRSVLQTPMVGSSDHGLGYLSEQVFHLSKLNRKTLTRVTSDLTKPNGITGTPDGKKLFVADIGADRTYSYKIQKDGFPDRQNPLLCQGFRWNGHR